MNKQVKRWLYMAGVLTCVMALLFAFRFELVFAYQRMRLHNLGCGGESRQSFVAPLDKLSPCEKLWAHRIDSYERFLYMKDYFAGLETDVVFDTLAGNFSIYHPPAKPIGLFVDAYFKQLKELHKGLWLDVKWVDTAAYRQAVDFLLQCDHLYGIKKYVVVESSQTPFINLLAQQGFATSYMIPYEYLLPHANHRAIDSVEQQLAPAVKFISQEDRFLRDIRAHVRNRKIITWALSINNYFNLQHFKSLINDTSISVVLVNCKSKGYL